MKKLGGFFSVRGLIAVLVSAVFWSFSALDVSAGGVDAGLNKVIERVMAKVRQGKRSESEFATELLMLSDLQEQCRSRKQEAAVVLLTKAGIYLAIIHDVEMGAMLLDQVRYEYPGTEAAVAAAAILSAATNDELSQVFSGMGITDFRNTFSPVGN